MDFKVIEEDNIIDYRIRVMDYHKRGWKIISSGQYQKTEDVRSSLGRQKITTRTVYWAHMISQFEIYP